jgi:phage head maturation protease
MEFLTCAFEVKASNSDDGTITGYGSFFGNVDSSGDIVAKGAFKKTLEESKSGAKSWPAMLLQHGGTSVDDKMPVGIWTEMSEDDNGLLACDRAYRYAPRIPEPCAAGSGEFEAGSARW